MKKWIIGISIVLGLLLLARVYSIGNKQGHIDGFKKGYSEGLKTRQEFKDYKVIIKLDTLLYLKK